MILGAALTIFGAYEYDSSTGRAPNGLSPTAAGGQAPMVNWDVVSDNWNGFEASVQNLIANLQKSFKRHAD
jgi:hypothetical protein